MKTKLNPSFVRTMSLAMLLAIVLPASAYDFMTNGIAYNINEDGATVTVTQNVQSHPTYSGDIVIPSAVYNSNNGVHYSVTAIDRLAFYACREMTSVTLPSTLVQIGQSAFSYCSGLGEIAIPASVQTIGQGAFQGCTSLVSIELPSGLTELNNNLFMSCSSLSVVRLPQYLKHIHSCVFDGCSSLTKIIIPDSVESIGNDAFRDCFNLEEITMGESLENIDREVFTSSCSSLRHIKWNTVDFQGFDNEDYNPFYIVNFVNNCITNFEFGRKVKTIPDYICRQFTGLTSISIPNSVTKIGKEAFAVCTGVTTINIPGSVTEIGESAFEGCSQLTSIFSSINDLQATACDVSAFNQANTSTCTLYVPKGTLSDYQTTAPWSQFMNIVELEPGDTNLDGTVTSADVTALYDHLLGCLDNAAAVACDVNGDGMVTAADVTALYNIILGNESQGHEWVDLGLPSGTLWATMNIGASSPEECGDYFAWGETAPKGVYDWTTYSWSNGSASMLTKYCENSSFGFNGFVDYKTELDPEDDAAAANWGAEWRMPSVEQVQELVENCSAQWTTLNGVYGMLFTGSNGATLFLPVTGERDGSELKYTNDGLYWLRTLKPTYSWSAYHLYVGPRAVNWYDDCFYRSTGLTVRAVRASQ